MKINFHILVAAVFLAAMFCAGGAAFAYTPDEQATLDTLNKHSFGDMGSLDVSESIAPSISKPPYSVKFTYGYNHVASNNIAPFWSVRQAISGPVSECETLSFDIYVESNDPNANLGVFLYEGDDNRWATGAISLDGLSKGMWRHMTYTRAQLPAWMMDATKPRDWNSIQGLAIEPNNAKSTFYIANAELTGPNGAFIPILAAVKPSVNAAAENAVLSAFSAMSGGGDVGGLDISESILPPSATPPFSLKVTYNFNHATSSSISPYWSVRTALPSASTPYTTLQFDIYVASADPEARLGIYLFDPNDNRWATTMSLSGLTTGTWLHYAYTRDHLTAWILDSTKPLDWNTIEGIAFEPSNAKSTFYIANLILTGPNGASMSLFNTSFTK